MLDPPGQIQRQSPRPREGAPIRQHSTPGRPCVAHRRRPCHGRPVGCSEGRAARNCYRIGVMEDHGGGTSFARSQGLWPRVCPRRTRQCAPTRPGSENRRRVPHSRTQAQAKSGSLSAQGAWRDVALRAAPTSRPSFVSPTFQGPIRRRQAVDLSRRSATPVRRHGHCTFC